MGMGKMGESITGSHKAIHRWDIQVAFGWGADSAY